MASLKLTLKKLITFTTPEKRLRRSRFLVMLGLWLVAAPVLLSIIGTSFQQFEAIFGLLIIFSLIITLFSCARRLQDCNISGWWSPLFLIIPFGWLMLLLWRGTIGPNDFGAQPNKES